MATFFKTKKKKNPWLGKAAAICGKVLKKTKETLKKMSNTKEKCFESNEILKCFSLLYRSKNVIELHHFSTVSITFDASSPALTWCMDSCIKNFCGQMCTDLKVSPTMASVWFKDVVITRNEVWWIWWIWKTRKVQVSTVVQAVSWCNKTSVLKSPRHLDLIASQRCF